jgi:hypothetical protein
MTEAYINHVAKTANTKSCCVTLCLLDEPETINQRIINRLSHKEAKIVVQGRCSALVSSLGAERLYSLQVTLWSSYALRRGFSKYLNVVTSLFKTSARFERHCRNQVFRNLQPVLRERGVTHKLHDLTGRLAGYILKEVALKLFISNRRLADLEFAPRPEMELVESIYSGRYPELIRLAHNRLPYIIVEPKVN